ncbi:DMT family transporter [Roseovarius salinarum]|uniref:DMT family transporter n=1 Tax=Roseovarius salinarum TaxID=1981892 RepID=UPI000C3218FE|nr:DMT family transporter [Roseovarius salinarum]
MPDSPRTPLSPTPVLMGAILAWVAVVIYASSNSIVTLLVEIGAKHPVDGRNAITFCNLLFLGSLMSMVPMLVIFHRDWRLKTLRALTPRDWVLLTVSAILSSALTPGLFFYALENTTVTNVVLIGRIEPPLFLLAAAAFLGERLDRWALVGGLVALAGAVLMIALKENGAAFSLGVGELAAAGATLSFIASTIITRAGLKGVPLGVFSIYRTALGTAIYFVAAIYLYGPDHFRDVFKPVVLQWTWVYAGIVILMGQFAWNIALKNARSGDVSLATSVSPLAAILIAMVLLGEDPGPGLVPGGAIILAGMVLAQVGRKRREWARKRAEERALELEADCGFKGA